MASKDFLGKKLGDLLTGHKPPTSALVPVSPAQGAQVTRGGMPFNPFDLDSDNQNEAPVQVTLGPQAQKMADRVALVRQIEQRLGIAPVQALELAREEPAPRIERTHIPALNMGRAVLQEKEMNPFELPPVRSTCIKPSAPDPKPKTKLSGLAADLHALEILRQRAESNLKTKGCGTTPIENAAKPKVVKKLKDPSPVNPPATEKAVRVTKAVKSINEIDKVKPLKSAKAAKAVGAVKEFKPPKEVRLFKSAPVPVHKAPAELSEFLDTPAYLQMESRAQADLAGFFMDEFQLIGFKDRILNERSKQVQLVPKYFNSKEVHFNLQAQAKRPDLLHEVSALYNEQDLNEWVDQLEKNFPPLYKQESRAERPEISSRTMESLKSLPLIGRNVTVGSMLNSWKLMGSMDRVRSLVIQPDFLRLDQQETFEHEIFLGQTALPSHRNHTLFKAKDMEGYLSNTALHLYRPRQLLAPHEDAEGYFARLHPVQKRGFDEQAFHGWFDKVFTTALSHVTLIESFVAEVVGRYTMVQRKLLKQAKAVSTALVQEMEASGTVLRQDTAFKMNFYQQHGFVPSDSFYEFLGCPVRGLTSETGLSMPLWQALGQGYEVHWKSIVLEEQPVDLVLLHFLALYAQSPEDCEGLIPTLGMLDLLVRCGDFLQPKAPSGTKKDKQEQDKSTALLKAYEYLMVEEELKSNPEVNHKLGAHHIVWDKQSQSTVACSAYLTQQHASQIHDAFSGLRQTLEGTGLWRDEIADWAKLLGREFGLVH